MFPIELARRLSESPPTHHDLAIACIDYWIHRAAQQGKWEVRIAHTWENKFVCSGEQLAFHFDSFTDLRAFIRSYYISYQVDWSNDHIKISWRADVVHIDDFWVDKHDLIHARRGYVDELKYDLRKLMPDTPSYKTALYLYDLQKHYYVSYLRPYLRAISKHHGSIQERHAQTSYKSQYLGAAIWLLDAFVWGRCVVDGDCAIRWRVLKFLVA